MSEPSPTPLSARALERRVKRWWLAGPFDCFIPCAPGLEQLLLAELRAGGFVSSAAEEGATTDGEPTPGDVAGPTSPVVERGGVSLRLGPEEIMRANLLLRTANRVLLRLADFHASTPAMLFDHLRRIPWEIHLGQAADYALRLSSRSSALSTGDAVMRTAAQAIERSMRDLGSQPRRAEEANLVFQLRLLADRCTVSFDTSGEHLHRRGIRRHVHEAPVRETLAAAVVLGGYHDHDLILDPFCGSGTLLVEAADIVSGRLPGRARGFAFEQAGWHRPGRWREVKRQAAAEAVGRSSADPPVRLIGMEIEPAALSAARHNLASDNYAAVELRQGDSTAIDLDAFGARRGLLVGNLPYGVRLGDRARAARTIERFLDRCLAARDSWDFAFLTMHAELFHRRADLKVSMVRTVSSGGLKVQLVQGRIH